MMHPDAEAALEDLKREFQIEIGGIVNDAIRRMRRSGASEAQIFEAMSELAPSIKAGWDRVFYNAERRLAGVTLQ